MPKLAGRVAVAGTEGMQNLSQAMGASVNRPFHRSSIGRECRSLEI